MMNDPSHLHDVAVGDDGTEQLLVLRVVLLLLDLGGMLQHRQGRHTGRSINANTHVRALRKDEEEEEEEDTTHVQPLEEDGVGGRARALLRGLPELLLGRVAVHRTYLEQAVWKRHASLLIYDAPIILMVGISRGTCYRNVRGRRIYMMGV